MRDAPSARILAVVQHGDEQAELPFLWRLCLASSALGYNVTVLDATIGETDQSPGLLQRLGRESTGTVPASAWTVLPAKEGLAQLSLLGQNHQRGWHQLLQCFAGKGVVIMYCNAECVASTLKGLDVPTLLPVSQHRASLLTSYLALKRLLIVGDQRPTIISVTPSDAAQDGAGVVCASLVECARNFLNFDARVIAFSDTTDDQTGDDVHRFTLKLLDSAGLRIPASPFSMQTLISPSSIDGSTPLHTRTADVHG